MNTLRCRKCKSSYSSVKKRFPLFLTKYQSVFAQWRPENRFISSTICLKSWERTKARSVFVAITHIDSEPLAQSGSINLGQLAWFQSSFSYFNFKDYPFASAVFLLNTSEWFFEPNQTGWDRYRRRRLQWPSRHQNREGKESCFRHKKTSSSSILYALGKLFWLRKEANN